MDIYPCIQAQPNVGMHDVGRQAGTCTVALQKQSPFRAPTVTHGTIAISLWRGDMYCSKEVGKQIAQADNCVQAQIVQETI